jgi:hypothetical protein
MDDAMKMAHNLSRCVVQVFQVNQFNNYHYKPTPPTTRKEHTYDNL